MGGGGGRQIFVSNVCLHVRLRDFFLLTTQ